MSSDVGPFEWLAGGLFFNKNAKGPIASIDASKDPLDLLHGTAAAIKTLRDSSPGRTTPIDSGEPEEPTESSLLEARLARLRRLLYDERQVPHSARRSGSTVVGTTVEALTSVELADLVPQLLMNLSGLPFESRKHVSAIFNYILVAGFKGSDSVIFRPPMERFRDYVEENLGSIMGAILDGHAATSQTNGGAQADVVLHYGSMYRSCLRHPSLYLAIVGSTVSAQRYVFPLLDVHVHAPDFDVSSDAMETLRIVLTGGSGNNTYDAEELEKMAPVAAEFLLRDYDEIWTKRFNPKLLSDSANYMTRRVSLQILSAVLLTRSNYAIMIKFVASRTNLILIMKLLRDTSPHITLDAFHVFKVFVANPNKPAEVVQILRDNKVKLCRYLRTLHQDKEEADTQFRDEKALIVATIEGL